MGGDMEEPKNDEITFDKVVQEVERWAGIVGNLAKDILKDNIDEPRR